jgi:hypothetical protein
VRDLPVSSLYAKAAELRNSIQHLEISNAQLKDFADAGDRDCAEAIKENDEVIQRMEHRILLLEYEVEENRKMKWHQESGATRTNAAAQEEINVNGTNGTSGQESQGNGARSAPAPSGTLSDEELRRRMAERMDDDADDGVYL